jgi:hypothetical protein
MRLSYVLALVVIGFYCIGLSPELPAQSTPAVDPGVIVIRPGETPPPPSEAELEAEENDIGAGECSGEDCPSVPEEIQEEAEAAGEEYNRGEERAENQENRRENERSFEGEKPADPEETAEYTEIQAEVDKSDSEEATEYVHESIREEHPDLGDQLLAWLGAIGAVASIWALIIVLK